MSSSRYKNRVRVRISGLLKKSGKVLMVHMNSPVTNEMVWMLPGGGLQFGEKMKDGLIREFREETGLKVVPGQLFAVNEVAQSPFHAIECYFEIQKVEGKLQLGHDPEYAEEKQIIKDLQWVSIDSLSERNIAPKQIKQWARSDYSNESISFYSQEI